MRHIYAAQPGETYFATSDIGWVVGHSYIVYGPLIDGMATIIYEGMPIRPDAGHLVEDRPGLQGDVMFTAPTATPRAEEAGSGLPQEVRSVVAAPPVPRRRAARRADRALDRGRARQADHRPLLADRDRLADPHRRAGRRAAPDQARQPELRRLRLRRPAPPRDDRRGGRAEREGRRLHRSRRCRPAACRPCGARTTAS